MLNGQTSKPQGGKKPSNIKPSGKQPDTNGQGHDGQRHNGQTNKEKGKKQKTLKLVLLLAFVALVIIILTLMPKLSPQALRDYFQAKGSAAAIYYILAFTILPAFFFPVTPLAVASGLAFSFWHGVLYTLIGALLNISLTFWLSRSLGQERFQNLIIKHDSRGWVKNYLQSGQTKSFYILLLLRLMPVVPFTLLNYASGLGQISYGSYVLASLTGMLPGTLVMVNLGDKVLDTGSPQFYLSLLLMVALVAGGFLAAKRITPDLDKASLRKALSRKVDPHADISDNPDTDDQES